ncbi:hypothetical protein TNCV_3476871 [Trichonephila clavipes]|nr:hypothetical protein TNCV_3476871 [Trichonephila clavipes]
MARKTMQCGKITVLEPNPKSAVAMGVTKGRFLYYTVDPMETRSNVGDRAKCIDQELCDICDIPKKRRNQSLGIPSKLEQILLFQNFSTYPCGKDIPRYINEEENKI